MVLLLEVWSLPPSSWWPCSAKFQHQPTHGIPPCVVVSLSCRPLPHFQLRLQNPPTGLVFHLSPQHQLSQNTISPSAQPFQLFPAHSTHNLTVLRIQKVSYVLRIRPNMVFAAAAAPLSTSFVIVDATPPLPRRGCPRRDVFALPATPIAPNLFANRSCLIVVAAHCPNRLRVAPLRAGSLLC